MVLCMRMRCWYILQERLHWCCSQCPMYMQLKRKKINQFKRPPQYTMEEIASICFKSQLCSMLLHCRDPQSRKLEGLEKTWVLKASFISIWKELLQSVSNLNCAQYYRQQTQECPKIQKAMGIPTTYICWLTSCPKLSKIKQNITEKHNISLKNEEK